MHNRYIIHVYKTFLLTARVGFRRVAWRSGPIDFHFLKEKKKEKEKN